MPEGNKGPDIAHFTYDYVDDTDNIDTQTYVHLQELPAPAPYSDFNYDNLDRLTSAAYHDTVTEDFSNMDDLGNRSGNITLRSGTVNFTVDDDTNRYTSNSLNQYSIVDSTGFSYDYNGNLTDDGIYFYDYDCENRLIEVTDGGSTIAKYYYDYAGRRIAKVTGGIETTYCYDGPQVIAEYEDGTLKRKFIYGPAIDEPIVMIDVTDSHKYYYYHFDGLGSVVALSDENADIVEKYTYDVFGKCTVHGPGLDGNWGTGDDITDANSLYDNPYLFTARRQDPETGLYYYRARMYNPQIGRFMQTDPVGYTAGLNLYTYCGNNPLNWIDPYGLDKDDDDEDDWWDDLMDLLKALENHLTKFLGVFKGGTESGMKGAGSVTLKRAQRELLINDIDNLSGDAFNTFQEGLETIADSMWAE